jgi:enoyl-CoA hydratase/carnithine racemase
MSVLEVERGDGIMVLRMNRPDRLNALNTELRAALVAAWTEFNESKDLEVAIFTGTGRAFCAGEDMKESVERGTPGGGAAGRREDDPFRSGRVNKPVIAALNGLAMGGGFLLVERTDLRVAVPGILFESSEAKRWLIGGYDHGVKNGLSHAVATELAFAFRFTSERLHQLGFINRIVEPDQLLPTAREMAAHLLSLPPACRVNTLTMMRAMRATVPDRLERFAEKLKDHGAKSDLMESRKAFAEKRKPVFKGWDDPADRARTPRLEDVK